MLLKSDPRSIAHSFDSPDKASKWADDLAMRLWLYGMSPEAKLIRKALSKVSSMIHTALYWKPRINLARVIPGENRLAFNDMNLVLFEWMDTELCAHARSKRSIAGPRESGKTILTVEIAPTYGGLPPLEKAEIEILRQSGILDNWKEETINSLHEHWVPYTFVLSDTERQSGRHLSKLKDHLPSKSCLLRWDWPKMCRLKVNPESSRVKEASKIAFELEAGVRMEAYGMTTGMLGSRYEATRPAYAVMDDLEPGVSWSPEAALDRARAVRDVVLPLSRILRAMIIATPQTERSIAHVLALHARDKLEITSDYSWVREWDPIVIEPWRKDGETFWKGVISKENLEKEERLSTWGVSYNSDPDVSQSTWWTEGVFVRNPPSNNPPIAVVCYIDPKKKERTSRKGSLAAWSFAVWKRHEPIQIVGGGFSGHIGRRLAKEVLQSMVDSDLRFTHLFYEDNAVGDSLRWDFREEGLGEIFGLEARQINADVNKEIRARGLLSSYEAKRIVHVTSPTIGTVENGLLMYMGGDKSSDMVDAVGGAVQQISILQLYGNNAKRGRMRRRKNYQLV